MIHDHEHYHKPKNKVPWWKTPFGMAYDDYDAHVPAFIPKFLSKKPNHKGA